MCPCRIRFRPRHAVHHRLLDRARTSTWAPGDGIDLLAQALLAGSHVYLDTLRLKVALTEAGGSVSGSAVPRCCTCPRCTPGSSASDVELTVGGSLAVTDDGAVKIAVGFDLAAANGAWTDAFGIPGLSIGELAANIGVEEQPEDLGIPLPTLSFTVNDVVLPAAWARRHRRGARRRRVRDPRPGRRTTRSWPSQSPPAPGQTAALEPLRIANDFTTVASAAPLPQLGGRCPSTARCSLLFAPTGGTDATGHAVSPGASLVFDATIAGKNVHVDGSIGVAPYPHLTAHVTIPGFNVGPVTLSGGTPGTNPTLAIDLEANPTAPKVDFDFSGGFTDVFTGIQFSANIDLGASISALNASVTLHIAGGQPAYIAAGAKLTGTVYSEGSGLAFSASGYADGYVAGHVHGRDLVQLLHRHRRDLRPAGSNWATRSPAGSATYTARADVAVAERAEPGRIWRQPDRLQVEAAFYDTDAQVATALTQIGTSARQIAATLRDVFADADVRAANALNRAGQYFSNTASRSKPRSTTPTARSPRRSTRSA